jgi:hypothetical protein
MRIFSDRIIISRRNRLDEIKEGDVVWLKSGGCSMTVCKINNGEAELVWQDLMNKICYTTIPLLAVRRVEA